METAAFAPILLESFRRQLRASGIEPAEPTHHHRRQRPSPIAAMLERWRARRRPATRLAPVAHVVLTRA